MNVDDTLLASLEDKLTIIRDRVAGVGKYTTGFYLWGPGGTSKSFSVEQKLKELDRPFRLTNTRATGKGLFTLLRDMPDVVHVLDDVETLFQDKNAFGVLRSALWGQPGPHGLPERQVHWQTGQAREEVVFTGGIILIANRPLAELPELKALQTRIACIHYEPTCDELAALMRKLAAQGYRHGHDELTPEECREVVDVIVERSARLDRHPDMRLMVNSFLDRLQWANGEAETHWLDLLDSRMKGRVVTPAGGVGVRAQRKQQELDVLRRIAGLPAQERLQEWMRTTGKSKAALYRRLGELSQFSHFLDEGQGNETNETRAAVRRAM